MRDKATSDLCVWRKVKGYHCTYQFVNIDGTLDLPLTSRQFLQALFPDPTKGHLHFQAIQNSHALRGRQLGTSAR